MKGKVISIGSPVSSKRNFDSSERISLVKIKIDSGAIKKLWMSDTYGNTPSIFGILKVDDILDQLELNVNDKSFISINSNFLICKNEVKDRTNYNKCSHLSINDTFKNSKDTLGDIINMQKLLQENAYNISFDDMTLGQIKDFWLINNHSFQDEVHEMFDALGGIKDGSGNAIWKYWKTKYKDLQNKKLNDLTVSDLKELKMEYIDMLHFFINFGLCLSMSSEEIYNYYMAKNQENINRQKNNY